MTQWPPLMRWLWESASTEKGTRGSKYKSKRKKHCVAEIDMSARETTRHPSCVLKRKVRIYPASTSSLYIGEKDLELFLDWMWDELETGGVTQAEETIGDLVPNCVAAGVHLRPDFTSHDLVYEAIVIDGDCKGKIVKSAVVQMTEGNMTLWRPCRSTRPPSPTLRVRI